MQFIWQRKLLLKLRHYLMYHHSENNSRHISFILAGSPGRWFTDPFVDYQNGQQRVTFWTTCRFVDLCQESYLEAQQRASVTRVTSYLLKKLLFLVLWGQHYFSIDFWFWIPLARQSVEKELILVQWKKSLTSCLWRVTFPFIIKENMSLLFQFFKIIFRPP